MQEEKQEKKDDLAANQDGSTELVQKERYDLTLEAMLRAGLHFGHKKSRWNPKMSQYIFGLRGGVHIIDLEKTLAMFQKALERLEKALENDGLVLLVGTKKQAKNLVKAVAERAGFCYVNERWLGGTFTNFEILRKRVKQYNMDKEILEKGRFSGLTKLERTKLQKKLEKIEKKMGGLLVMKKMPSLMIVLDAIKDRQAVKEAKAVGVETIGLVDTNSDPKTVTYPIPANDDALSALKYVLGVILKKTLEVKGAVGKAKEA